MIESFWELKKVNPRGRPFSRAGAGRSFVKNMICLLYLQAKMEVTGYSMTDIFGVSASRTIHRSHMQLPMAAGGQTVLVASGSTYLGAQSDLNQLGQNLGIVIGTGTTAVDVQNTALETKIAHGKASGQLIHWGGFIDAPVVSAPYAYFDAHRIFENASGGSIVVSELGLYAAQGTGVYLTCHDVLALEDRVTLLNMELLKVTYRIRLSV